MASDVKNKLCLSAELGGGRWIRTTEGIASRFTVCPLWPLGNSPMFNWSWWTDSNPRPADYKSAALPTELHQHLQGQQPSSSRSDIIAEPPSFVNSFFHHFFCVSCSAFSGRIPYPRILPGPRVQSYSYSLTTGSRFPSMVRIVLPSTSVTMPT